VGCVPPGQTTDAGHVIVRVAPVTVSSKTSVVTFPDARVPVIVGVQFADMLLENTVKPRLKAMSLPDAIAVTLSKVI
jgi:hypothetical protein